MKDVCFLIHGSYGNPYKNFFPYLHKSITKKGYYVIAPQFPVYSIQSYDNWSNILEQYLNIGLLSESSTVITHSLGSIFIVKRFAFFCPIDGNLCKASTKLLII